MVDEKHYHRQNLHTLRDDLDTESATSKSDENAIGFFGEIQPFSNFHPCKFSHDDIDYNSSEQFIQARKAEYFKDDVAMARILTATF